MSRGDHREAMAQCWEVYREGFDSDAAAIGALEASKDGDWREWANIDTYTAFWEETVEERGKGGNLITAILFPLLRRDAVARLRCICRPL
jgi:hypothetical protein